MASTSRKRKHVAEEESDESMDDNNSDTTSSDGSTVGLDDSDISDPDSAADDDTNILSYILFKYTILSHFTTRNNKIN